MFRSYDKCANGTWENGRNSLRREYGKESKMTGKNQKMTRTRKILSRKERRKRNAEDEIDDIAVHHLKNVDEVVVIHQVRILKFSINFVLQAIYFTVHKMKKDNEPPLRLLDDLFRKTKAVPCVYWLPLTPEQVSF